MLKWRWNQRDILDSFYEWLLYHYSGLGVRMRIPLYMAISVYRTRMVGSNCLVRFARSAWDEMTSRVDTLRPEIPPALGPSSCHFWTLLLAQGSSGCACPRSPSAELAGDRLIGRRLSGNTPTLLALISLILRFKIQT